MDIKDFIQNLVSEESEDRCFKIVPDGDGLNFILPKDDFERCRNGQGSGLALHQYVCLRMLEEQGYAESMANGYTIPSDHAVILEEDAKALLGFPPAFLGEFRIRVEGETSRAGFAVRAIPILPDGTEIFNYEIKGPCLKLSSHELYLLSPGEWLALSALCTHQDIPSEQRTELQNLKLVGSLQAAKKLGMAIDLGHFNKMAVLEPEKIGVAVTQQDDGSLLLTPAFGAGIDLDSVHRRLGQLKGANDIGVIRIKDKIVLLEEQRLQAAHEIISNRIIPPHQVKRFLESPTAFLDASLVNLDGGFSLRVRGAAAFKHAYFGETDESGISWFERGLEKADSVSQPSVLHKLIENPEDLLKTREQIADARNAGATILDISGKTIDISDTESVNNILKSIERKIEESPQSEKIPETSSEGQGPKDEATTPIIVDIELNDLLLGAGTDDIPALIRDVAYKPDIDYSIYKRQPFPHQNEGVRWILGSVLPTFIPEEKKEGFFGALLADDMGLGKTYMTLVAISEYYQQCRKRDIVERPVLIVVPLTLLENWKEEIENTFLTSPFADIVMLQADADLKRFRIEGAGVEIRQQAAEVLLQAEDTQDVPESAIRYSLKFGKEFKYDKDKLDLPRRVVLTTYQTLRDYQFSLCRIDWSFVVFDEAQNIKNPNTLATRAAKGLKAQFKLLATGTPVENHLGDFWCLMDTARPGWLGTYQEFRQQYIAPIRQASPEKIAEQRLILGKQLRSKVGSLMLRRLKEDNLHGLPKKRIYAGLDVGLGNGCIYDPLLEREMGGEQLQRYDTAISTVIELQQQGDGGNPMLAGLHQLREISLHPLLLNQGLLGVPEGRSDAHGLFLLSGKLEMLLGILDKIKEREEKAIVFLINKRLQSFLKMALGRIYGINIDVINGDTKAIVKSPKTAAMTRKGIIDAFESSEGFGVVIMSPIAAGTGLTVVGANNVIHLERHWNPAKEDQATDRVYRIGQKKDVNVYLPILKHPSVDSFDVNLHKLLSNKVTLKDAVVTPEEVSNEEMAKANFRTNVNSEDQGRPLRGGDLSFLSWQEFEALCAELYGQHFKGDAFLTPTNDQGADAVVMGEVHALIQCKHTSRNKYDSTDPLIQIHGAKPAYEANTRRTFTKLIVAVNVSKFSKRVADAARTYNVELVGLKQLDKLLKQYHVSRKQIQKRLLEARFFENIEI